MTHSRSSKGEDHSHPVLVLLRDRVPFQAQLLHTPLSSPSPPNPFPAAHLQSRTERERLDRVNTVVAEV
eukprot:756453-Hanusia_phi.AAC.1